MLSFDSICNTSTGFVSDCVVLVIIAASNLIDIVQTEEA